MTKEKLLEMNELSDEINWLKDSLNYIKEMQEDESKRQRLMSSHRFVIKLIISSAYGSLEIEDGYASSCVDTIKQSFQHNLMTKTIEFEKL